MHGRFAGFGFGSRREHQWHTRGQHHSDIAKSHRCESRARRSAHLRRWRRGPGKRLGDLPGQPLGCRMPCHLEPQQLSPAITRTRNANKRSKVSVGTTHTSMAARLSVISRNVFQICDGSFEGRAISFETVDWATSKPSIRSSPWTRDAPQSGFSLLIRRIRSRRPRSILGPPTLLRDFQRQNRCQRRIVSG